MQVELGDLRSDTEIGQRICIDILMFVVMLPWLLFKAWQVCYGVLQVLHRSLTLFVEIFLPCLPLVKEDRHVCVC